jgi:hypothetical protein
VEVKRNFFLHQKILYSSALQGDGGTFEGNGGTFEGNGVTFEGNVLNYPLKSS